MPKQDKRVPRARRLRREMTDAEWKLWHNLSRIPVEETHFRRQATIGPYFADFACHRKRIVVEIDGEQHGFDANRRADERRTAYPEAAGFRVLRFWNHEVLQELESVLDTIYAAIGDGAPRSL
jgi:very-short-patch-repair endonuclease